MSDCARRDLVGGWLAFLFWGIPTIAIIAGVFVPAVRALLWVPSFAVMGAACVVNARGCGRLHCYITGPLFLLGALVSTLDAFGIVNVDWRLVLAAMSIGTVAAYSVEWVRGKYVETSPP